MMELVAQFFVFAFLCVVVIVILFAIVMTFPEWRDK